MQQIKFLIFLIALIKYLNATWSHWWYFDSSSGDSLVLSGQEIECELLLIYHFAACYAICYDSFCIVYCLADNWMVQNKTNKYTL